MDDAVDGIGAPDGAAGAAERLDALDAGRRTAEALLLARYRGDRDIGALFERMIFQRKRACGILRHAGMGGVSGRMPAACVQQKQCRTSAG